MSMRIPSRAVLDGEQLAIHRFSNGVVALVPADEVRDLNDAPGGVLWREVSRWWRGEPRKSAPFTEVIVPQGTHLIMKSIPGPLRQRYGLEADEGVIFVLHSDAYGRTTGMLQCSNGAQIRLQELRGVQYFEVLSLALAEDKFVGCLEASLR